MDFIAGPFDYCKKIMQIEIEFITYNIYRISYMSKNNTKNISNNNGIKFLFLPLLFLAALFFTWFGPSIDITDPWFDAVLKVDSASKVTDPALRSKLMDEGGAELKKLIKEYPFHARVHFMLGFYYMKSGKMDSAISEFRETIKIDSGATINPVWTDAVRLLSTIYVAESNELVKNKTPELALKKLNEAKDLAKFSDNINAQYGVLYHQAGQLDSAEIYYLRTLQINPNHKGVIKNLSLIYLLRGNERLQEKKYNEALRYYTESYKINKSNPDLLNNMAMAYMNTGDTQNAIQFFIAAVNLNPNHQNALSNLANVYQKVGDKKNSELILKRLNNLKGK